MRYTLNMDDWTLKEGSPRDLLPDTELRHSFEFSNINPSYLGKKYKYIKHLLTDIFTGEKNITDDISRFGYFSHNVFKLDGAVVKVNTQGGNPCQIVHHVRHVHHVHHVHHV